MFGPNHAFPYLIERIDQRLQMQLSRMDAYCGKLTWRHLFVHHKFGDHAGGEVSAKYIIFIHDTCAFLNLYACFWISNGPASEPSRFCAENALAWNDDRRFHAFLLEIMHKSTEIKK